MKSIAPPTPPRSHKEFFRGLISGFGEIAGIWTGVHGSADPESLPADAKPNTGYLLLFVLASDSIARRILEMYHVMADEISRELTKLPPEEFFVSEIRIIRRREPRPEDDDWELSVEKPAPHGLHRVSPVHRQKEKDSMLEKYGADLTKAAADGKLDPVVCRAREIERMIQILGRRKKNNPVLVGEAGVGKKKCHSGGSGPQNRIGRSSGGTQRQDSVFARYGIARGGNEVSR